jgi:hypothetical protein
MVVHAVHSYLHLLIRPTEESLLSHLHNRAIKIHASIYANDAAIFVHPVKEEVQVLHQLLEAFDQASGMRTNPQKRV